MPLLSIRDLRVDLGGVRVVDGVSLEVEEGETLCLVGESGCGKSVTALSIARLLEPPPVVRTSGEIRVEGREITAMSKSELRRVRGRVVGYVFQEAATALNPVMRIGAQIRESIRLNRPGRVTEADVAGWLARVGIAAPTTRCRDYPHQLSGGMQQRVMMAMALASGPRLLVADEPTTALDVTTQAQILELLRDLRREARLGVLLITHNFGVVAEIADRVAVMYAGQIVETGPAAEILGHPRHPYTRALMASVPVLGRDAGPLVSIPGQVPRPGAWPSGCRFHPRCPHAREDCRSGEPELVRVNDGEPPRWVRCPYWDKPVSAPGTESTP